MTKIYGLPKPERTADFKAGYAACMKGLPITTCPYKRADKDRGRHKLDMRVIHGRLHFFDDKYPECFEWESGWCEARVKLNGY